MPYRSPARYFAPLAVLASVFAVYSVVHTNLDTSGSPAPVSKTVDTVSAKKTSKHKSAATYVVRSGDTLSAIAEKTGVSLTTLQSLNAKIDANALRTGQKLRLRAAS